MNIAVIGSGSWGIALSIYLAKQGNNIKVWSFVENEKNAINQEKKCIFLPNVELPEGIYCTNNYEEALLDTEVVLHVTPSKFTRNIIKGYKEYIKPNQFILMCSKGFEAGTNLTLGEVIEQELPGIKYGILSGPSHAEEVAIGVPTALVVASKNDEVIQKTVDLFKSNILRIYHTDDVKGVELGGALKNIIAFCAGAAVSLNCGDNTFAMLLSRGLVEIARLGIAMGGENKTFYGLTGLGDLIVTCGSQHSRNRRAGELIGKGYTIEEARKQIGMTIESIDNIDVAYSLSKKYNIEMPIVETVYNVLYNGLQPQDAINILMTREAKAE